MKLRVTDDIEEIGLDNDQFDDEVVGEWASHVTSRIDMVPLILVHRASMIPKKDTKGGLLTPVAFCRVSPLALLARKPQMR